MTFMNLSTLILIVLTVTLGIQKSYILQAFIPSKHRQKIEWVSMWQISLILQSLCKVRIKINYIYKIK